MVVNNASVSGSVTSYEYERVCFSNTTNTADLFYWGSMALFIIVFFYFLISFIWYWFTSMLGFSFKNGRFVRTKGRGGNL